MDMNDYGCDPIENGKFRMVPSGDVVDAQEKEKRLSHLRQEQTNDCLGKSWAQIAMMQGGLETLDITKTKKKK